LNSRETLESRFQKKTGKKSFPEPHKKPSGNLSRKPQVKHGVLKAQRFRKLRKGSSGNWVWRFPKILFRGVSGNVPPGTLGIKKRRFKKKENSLTLLLEKNEKVSPPKREIISPPGREKRANLSHQSKHDCLWKTPATPRR